MNKLVKDILDSSQSNNGKIIDLNILKEEINSDIDLAKSILSGEYKYCANCDDYYLKESFLTSSETKEERICTYNDPINSGGNEYEDGYVDYKYEVCPKGHRHVISQHQRRR